MTEQRRWAGVGLAGSRGRRGRRRRRVVGRPRHRQSAASRRPRSVGRGTVHRPSVARVLLPASRDGVTWNGRVLDGKSPSAGRRRTSPRRRWQHRNSQSHRKLKDRYIDELRRILRAPRVRKNPGNIQRISDYTEGLSRRLLNFESGGSSSRLRSRLCYATSATAPTGGATASRAASRRGRSRQPRTRRKCFSASTSALATQRWIMWPSRHRLTFRV